MGNCSGGDDAMSQSGLQSEIKQGLGNIKIEKLVCIKFQFRKRARRGCLNNIQVILNPCFAILVT